MLNSTKAKTKRIGIRPRGRNSLLRGDCRNAPAAQRSPAQDLEPQLLAGLAANVKYERGVNPRGVGQVLDRRVLADVRVPIFLATRRAPARPVVHGRYAVRLQVAR